MLNRLLLGVIAGITCLLAAFYFFFGTLSPCDALREEYRRVGQNEAGAIGKVVMGVAGDANADGMAPVECVQRAVQLRFRGKQALPSPFKGN